MRTIMFHQRNKRRTMRFQYHRPSYYQKCPQPTNMSCHHQHTRYNTRSIFYCQTKRRYHQHNTNRHRFPSNINIPNNTHFIRASEHLSSTPRMCTTLRKRPSRGSTCQFTYQRPGLPILCVRYTSPILCRCT